jgi:hypothetical protein
MILPTILLTKNFPDAVKTPLYVPEQLQRKYYNQIFKKIGGKENIKELVKVLRSTA